MKVSICTQYRIVKAIRNEKTYFVPQYQEDGDPKTTFHNYKIPLNVGTGGYRDIYFEDEQKAWEFLVNAMLTADEVIILEEAH